MRKKAITKIRFLDVCNNKELSSFGKPGSVSVRRCLKELILGFGPVKGNFRKGSMD